MSRQPPGRNGGDKADKLAVLGARIEAARNAGKPKPREAKEEYAAASMAWRMVFELVASIGIGTAMGWGLDALFGTLPLFLIVFIMLGFAAGVRTVMRSAAEIQRKQLAEAAAKDEQGGKSPRANEPAALAVRTETKNEG